MKLGSVVDGDALEERLLLVDELNRGPVQSDLGVIGELGNQYAAGRALDERRHAVFAGAAHRIHLPVTEFPTEFHGSRTLRDVPLAGQSASLLVRSVALAVLRPLTEVPIELRYGGVTQHRASPAESAPPACAARPVA